MKALIHAELLKIRTRTALGLLLAALAMEAVMVAASIPNVGAENVTLALDDPALLTGTVGTVLLAPQVLVVLLGALSFTQEFRYGLITATYLCEPRRGRVLVAKWVALAIASVVITTASLALTLTFSIVLIRSRDGVVTLDGPFWAMLAGGFAMMAASAVIGVAIGALVRNQIAAVAGVLFWMLAVEHIVIPAYPAFGRWLPGGATWALLQLGPALPELNGKPLLSAAAGGLIVVVYTAAAVVLALVITPRRDVL